MAIKKQGTITTAKQEEVDPFEAAFNAAEAGQGGSNFPVGTHSAVVTAATLHSSDKDASLKVRFNYTGSDGEAAGIDIQSFYQIKNKDGDLGKGVSFFKKDMMMLGVETFRFSEIEDALQQIEGTEVVINVVVKDTYKNAYLESVIKYDSVLD